MRAIVDLDPNDGDVRLDEIARNKVPADEWRRLVAMVPAESGWWSDLVGDHFEPDDDLDALLDAIGLPDALGWKVDRLSTGERHRLAIARAIANRPLALLLDEPTAALGVAQTRQVLDLVRRLAEQGFGVVIISHNLHDIFEVSDRVTVLRLGQQVGVLERDKTSQKEVVELITAGELAHVPGMEGANES